MTDPSRSGLGKRLLLFLASLASFACSSAPKDWDTLKLQLQHEFPEVSHVSTESVAAMLDATDSEKPVLLDVRPAAERAVSQLQGALAAHTRAEALEALADSPKDRLIILYCAVSYRSSALAADLQVLGYTNVHDMEGSIFQWANEGRPVYRNGERVTVVHPYNDDWGRLLNEELHSTGK